MEGRSSPRVKVRDILATIRRKGFLLSVSRAEPAEVIDIGPKGLCLLCESTLEPDTQLAMTVVIPDKRTIKCSGIVRNFRKSDRGCLLGVEFTKLSSRDRKYLTENLLEIEFFAGPDFGQVPGLAVQGDDLVKQGNGDFLLPEYGVQRLPGADCDRFPAGLPGRVFQAAKRGSVR